MFIFAQKVLVYSLFFTICISSVCGCNVSAIQKIQDRYACSLPLFFEMQKNSLLGDWSSMHKLFLGFDMSSHDILKQIRLDQKTLRKQIRLAKKYKDSKSTMLQKDLQNLGDLYRYIKKYKLNNDVLRCHNKLHEKYDIFCEYITYGKDIMELLPEIGINNIDVDGLRAMIEIVAADQKKIDEYEDWLHADWVDLKLANYVYKIELIRVRNAAMFHPLLSEVKFESSYPW